MTKPLSRRIHRRGAARAQVRRACEIGSPPALPCAQAVAKRSNRRGMVRAMARFDHRHSLPLIPGSGPERGPSMVAAMACPGLSPQSAGIVRRPRRPLRASCVMDAGSAGGVGRPPAVAGSILGGTGAAAPAAPPRRQHAQFVATGEDFRRSSFSIGVAAAAWLKPTIGRYNLDDHFSRLLLV